MTIKKIGISINSEMISVRTNASFESSGSLPCNPEYCLPDAYNTCNPEMDEDGGCDPHYDDMDD